MSKALNALTCLVELGLLQKPALRELVSEIVPFLCHPVSFMIQYHSMVYILYVPWILEKLGVADVPLRDDVLQKKNRPCQSFKGSELHALLFANSVCIHLCPTKL